MAADRSTVPGAAASRLLLQVQHFFMLHQWVLEAPWSSNRMQCMAASATCARAQVKRTSKGSALFWIKGSFQMAVLPGLGESGSWDTSSLSYTLRRQDCMLGLCHAMQRETLLLNAGPCHDAKTVRSRAECLCGFLACILPRE